MPKGDQKLHLVLGGVMAAVFVWSAINPAERFTWWLEVAPVLIGLPIVLVKYRSFPLTRLVWILISAHVVILLVGGHYTYAEVPLFNDLRDYLQLKRNHYDRLGHFAQGFVPAIIARELFLRLDVIRTKGWLFFIVVFVCLGISALYELIEWFAALSTGDAANAFLGAQGDQWDAQADMLCAVAGALSALLLLSKVHDREIARLERA